MIRLVRWMPFIRRSTMVRACAVATCFRQIHSRHSLLARTAVVLQNAGGQFLLGVFRKARWTTRRVRSKNFLRLAMIVSAFLACLGLLPKRPRRLRLAAATLPRILRSRFDLVICRMTLVGPATTIL